MHTKRVNGKENMNPERQPTLVMKFGGTSVGSPQAMRQAGQIVLEEMQAWPRMVVVTSAMSGVTNLLLKTAEQAVRGETQAIAQAAQSLISMHFAVIDQLIEDEDETVRVKRAIDRLIQDFANLCQAIGVLGEATPRALDAVASLGERLSVRLLSAALRQMGLQAHAVEATNLIVTDRHFQSALPDFQATSANIQRFLIPMLAQRQVPVVTGFIGATPDGVITTLGRGGSDYSAAILGALLPSDEVWIWTDVDGVMSADPRLVPEARTIPRLTYREIAELAYYGAKVVHPKTIRPVINAGIGLRVCNTFNPSHPGTRLIAEEGQTGDGSTLSQGLIRAVTAIRGQKLLTIEGRGMLGVPGVAARAFGAVAATGTSVPLITQSSSEQSICFAVPAEAAGRVMGAMQEAFAIELKRSDIDRIWATEEVVIITVVGAGMRHTPGIAGRIFGALGEQHVNVIAIAQGSSEVSVSMVVDYSQSERAVRALHRLIVSEGVPYDG